jgi:hypothetical protein
MLLQPDKLTMIHRSVNAWSWQILHRPASLPGGGEFAIGQEFL